jgi:superfamily II DNA or RNA helicase
MTIRADEVEQAVRIALPRELFKQKLTAMLLQLEVVASEIQDCTCHVIAARNARVRILSVRMISGDPVIVALLGRETGHVPDTVRLIRANDMNIVNGTLILDGESYWARHPDVPTGDTTPLVRAIRSTWLRDISLASELRTGGGQVTRPGLRSPQVGALHALAAHWTVGAEPALVVLPTGTGKTEVMIASMLMRRPSRLLVLVPSDTLRSQTSEKFSGLGVLKTVNIALPMHRRPLVGTLLAAPKTSAALKELQRANVVVSTVSMLHALNDTELSALLDSFDTVFFDEAHHIPALSWDRIYSHLSNHSVVGFTATPFRLDGERVPGKVVYQFPLRLAQQQGYFTRINFIPVDEADQGDADREIALKAVERVRLDREAGHPHILLARAATRMRAEQLWKDLYSVIAADLSPILIHSGVSGRRALLRDIRAGCHGVVVCVDMFGEGFDLPTLKVAAMHDLHRSLAITLQFTGRFTRGDPQLGAATLVANVGEPRVQEAIEDLYGEDADWNEVIPDLSARAIAGHLEIAEFLERMQLQGESVGAFDLSILKPKTSAVIYRANRFSPRRFRQALPRSAKVHRVWISKDRDVCVFIVQNSVSIDWASVKEVSDEIWDLYVLAYDRTRGVLFIHGSQTKSIYANLARAVSGPNATIIGGEAVFRALANVQRLVFHNVGLYGRGKLRFKMYTGYDVSEVIGPPAQAGSTKSNVFAVGYEGGKKTTIGVSLKGRVWSMASSPVPQWISWCRHVATKLLNDALPTNGFLAHTLVPEEIAALPDTPIIAILPPDEWLDGQEHGTTFLAGAEAITPLAAGITSWQRLSNQTVSIDLEFSATVTSSFEMRWGDNRFQVSQIAGTPLLVRAKDGEVPIAEHLSENWPIVLLTDGSEIRGNKLLKHPRTFPMLFDPNQIRVLNWEGVPLRVESKWRHGVRRADSIQGRFIDDRVAAENTYIIDDDDTGESADVVEIVQGDHDLLFRLYHCKYSQADEPGVRVGDLYEVCGQAVRSSRLTTDPERLLRHLDRREGELARGGRPTRFEKGTPVGLRALRRRIERYRCRFEIAIVQPGLHREALTPEATSVLAAADMFIREFTGTPLTVYASA